MWNYYYQQQHLTPNNSPLPRKISFNTLGHRCRKLAYFVLLLVLTSCNVLMCPLINLFCWSLNALLPIHYLHTYLSYLTCSNTCRPDWDDGTRDLQPSSNHLCLCCLSPPLTTSFTLSMFTFLPFAHTPSSIPHIFSALLSSTYFHRLFWRPPTTALFLLATQPVPSHSICEAADSSCLACLRLSTTLLLSFRCSLSAYAFTLTAFSLWLPSARLVLCKKIKLYTCFNFFFDM